MAPSGPRRHDSTKFARTLQRQSLRSSEIYYSLDKYEMTEEEKHRAVCACEGDIENRLGEQEDRHPEGDASIRRRPGQRRAEGPRLGASEPLHERVVHELWSKS